MIRTSIMRSRALELLLLLLLPPGSSGQQQRRRPLLLMTPGRSGSSFVSSWFAKGLGSNKTLYMLESCSGSFHQLPKQKGVSSESDVSGTVCAGLVDELLSCNFGRVSLRNQRSTLDGFNFPWGNVSSVDGCGNDGRLVFIKEIRLGAPVYDALLSGRSPFRAAAPAILAIDRDPRAVLASRKVVWTGWAHVVGKSVDGLPSHSSSSSSSLSSWLSSSSSSSSSSWSEWLAEAVTENNENPFLLEEQRGHPYTQSMQSLCTEMLAARRFAEVKARAALSPESTVVDPLPPFLLLDYEADVLSRPKATAQRVLRFAGLGDDQEGLRAVAAFVDAYVSGKCDSKNMAFSTCRNHSSGGGGGSEEGGGGGGGGEGGEEEPQGAPIVADDKWVGELESWERFLVERQGSCRELLVAQGRAASILYAAPPTDGDGDGGGGGSDDDAAGEVRAGTSWRALEEEARLQSAVLRKEAALIGAKLQITFVVVAASSCSAPSTVGIFWVQRHSRGTGQAKEDVGVAGTEDRGRIKARALIGSVDACRGGEFGIATTHTHEFMLVMIDEDHAQKAEDAFDSGAPTLLRWVANATKGTAQTARVDLGSSSSSSGDGDVVEVGVEGFT